MAKIKAGDEVVVISGKDRGRTGKVQRVEPKKDRLVVEGVNIIKRHQRPNQMNHLEAGNVVAGL